MTDRDRAPARSIFTGEEQEVKKQKNAAQQTEALKAKLKADIERWHYLRENGCSDPFWPDGTNLNLVRNHIIFDLREIASLDQSDRQLSIFDVGGVDNADPMDDPRIPPKVDKNLMVRDRYERGRRIKMP